MTVLDLLGVVLPFVGTVLLVVLYYYTLRQQKRQTNIQSLAYLPQMVVESQDEEEINFHGEKHASSKNWFCLRNSGDVPFKTSVSIALAEHNQLDPNSDFLDKGSSFEDINDEFKVSLGDGSWIDNLEFLNPGDTKRWRMGMFMDEISDRHEGHVPENFWCVRVDAELQSTLEPAPEHDITRLFDMYTAESPSLVPITYEQMKEKTRD
ncbi:hypothetical protein [Halapricum desulfuricans]|uniref:hypothetical protein n=1 Tax=Halapricum desulfuricans TaxID=2841257 RepID=UPI001E341E13|nr:hypothetical protein [Halapricum desulfuricans]